MKKILFTGARSGISNAVIERIKNKNFEIYLTVHTENQLKRVTEKYQNNSNIHCLKLDITDQKDKEKLKELDIDILVNNAAIGIGGSIAEVPIEKVKENFEVNVFSTFEIVQIVLKKMMQKKSGKIIIMSSLAGRIPVRFLGIYCATKASIIKLTETLNQELKMINSNIKISMIEPGLYHTGFNQVMFENKYKQMSIDSYFKSQIEILRKQESFITKYLERKKLNTIVNKIEKSIVEENPKFIYRAPLSQAIFAKIYNLFN